MTEKISKEVSEKRRKAVENANYSMMLSGFELDPEQGEIQQRYIRGEIDGEEQTRLVFALVDKRRAQLATVEAYVTDMLEKKRRPPEG